MTARHIKTQSQIGSNMKNTGLIIFGSKGSAVELEDYITDLTPDEFGFVRRVFIEDDLIAKNELERYLNDPDFSLHYIFGVMDYDWRKNALDQIAKFPNFQPYSFIHPSAFVAKTASIGKGVFIHANVTVSTECVINDHVLLHMNSSVGHHSIISEHATLLPGVRVSGNVNVGKRCIIGSNSVVFQGVNIGDDNRVDCLSYIKSDLKPHMITFAAMPTSKPRKK